MLEERREKFELISEKVGRFFSKSKIHPNYFTLISILFGVFCFLSLLWQNLISGMVFFVLAAFCDFVDGAVARTSLKVTKVGAYLDTIFDRYVEGMVLAGFFFLPLPKFFIPASVWIFLCLFGSLMTTYAKAAAKEKEMVKKELKKGLFGRPERMILIFLSLFLGVFNLYWLVFVLIILAIFSNFTALERIYSVLNVS